jgi:hypothetical protein
VRGGGYLVQGLLARDHCCPRQKNVWRSPLPTAEKWLKRRIEEDGPWERAPARLPSPVLVRLVGAAVRLAGELRLDVGALLLLVPRPRRLVVHPLPLPDVAPRRRRAALLGRLLLSENQQHQTPPYILSARIHVLHSGTLKLVSAIEAGGALTWWRGGRRRNGWWSEEEKSLK